MLHVYLDETGHHNKSENFIVCVVVIDSENIDTVLEALEQIEVESGKKSLKWAKSEYERNETYIRQVAKGQLDGNAYGLIFPCIGNEVSQKCEAIARAVKTVSDCNQRVHVHIDGELGRRQETKYRNEIRKHGITVYKVKGIRKSQDNALVRLANALCGLMRSYQRGGMQRVYKMAIDNEVLLVEEKEKATS